MMETQRHSRDSEICVGLWQTCFRCTREQFCVPDVSVLKPPRRAAQPMRIEEDFVRVGRLKNTRSVQLTSRGRVQDAEGVRFTQPSKGTQLDAKELRRQEDAACLGGMRRALSSVARLPSALLHGKQIRDLCWDFVDQQPGVVSVCSGAIGPTGGIIPEHFVDAFAGERTSMYNTSPSGYLGSVGRKGRGPWHWRCWVVETWCTSGVSWSARYIRIFPNVDAESDLYLDPLELDCEVEGLLTTRTSMQTNLWVCSWMSA